jgi:putative PIN family toxin of toxin-antitoxin system
MIKNLQIQIANFFTIVYPLHLINVVRDKDGNRVLDTAVESNSSIIITGDKDLLVLGKYKKIKIMSPKDFLDMYL